MNKCFWCKKHIWFWDHRYYEDNHKYNLHLRCYPDYKYKTTQTRIKHLTKTIWEIENLPFSQTSFPFPITVKEYREMKDLLQSLMKELENLK